MVGCDGGGLLFVKPGWVALVVGSPGGGLRWYLPFVVIFLNRYFRVPSRFPLHFFNFCVRFLRASFFLLRAFFISYFLIFACVLHGSYHQLRA